jgi:hypothetical protein
MGDVDSRRGLSTRLAKIAVAVVSASGLAATVILVLLALLVLRFGSWRQSPYDVAFDNTTDATVEVAPVVCRGRDRDGESWETALSNLSGGTLPSLLGGYVYERARVFSVPPHSKLRFAIDCEGWIDAVLIREHGGSWLVVEDALLDLDCQLGLADPLLDLAVLAPADPLHASFVEQYRTDRRPTGRTFLLLGPALLLARLTWCTLIARRRSSLLAPWNWPLEVVLVPLLLAAAFALVSPRDWVL